MNLMRRIRERFVNWLLKDVHVSEPFHIGKNSLTMGFGGNDILHWTGTATPTNIGEIGMNLISGRPEIVTAGLDITELGLLRSIFYTTLAGVATISATTGFTTLLTKAINVGTDSVLIFRASLSGNILGTATPEHLNFRFQYDGVTVGAGSAITIYPATPSNSGTCATLVVFLASGVVGGGHTVDFQWDASTVTVGTGSIDPTILAQHCTITIEEYTIPNN